MSYCAPADVRRVMAKDAAATSGQGTQSRGTAASLSDADIQAHINDASAEVDAALTSAPSNYVLPFPVGDPPSGLVFAITRDIAAYRATLEWKKGALVPADSATQKRQDFAEGLLARIQAGTLVLPGYGASPDDVAAVVNFVPDSWTWTPDYGFGVSDVQTN